MALEDSQDVIKARRLLRLSATFVLVGVLLAVAEQRVLGGWVTILSLLALIWTLHRFGRLGPDQTPASSEGE